MDKQITIPLGDKQITEKHVFLQSGGATLTGVLAIPAQGALQGAFLFSHGWAGNRNGPANLLTTLARFLAANGYATLRFDFRGRGEAGGDGLATTLATMAEDLASAASFLRKETGMDALSILGMCSGGNVAIGALPNLGKVQRLVLLSVYPFSDGDSFGRDINRSRHFLAVYLRKACSLENWKRVFTGDASLARVFRVIFRPFLKRGENRAKEGNVGTLVKAAASESRNSAAPPPVKHLAKLRKDVPALMLYGTADPDATAAQKYFGDYASKNALPISFVEIQGANHNFSSQTWQQQVLEKITNSTTNN